MDSEAWVAWAGGREPSRVIAIAGVPYMEHFDISPGLRLHHILRSDPDPDLHDHPWDFESTILDGSYLEFSDRGSVALGPGDVLCRKAADLHRLVLAEPVWTLFRFGPWLRTWGFQTPEGWIPRRQYRRSEMGRARSW